MAVDPMEVVALYAKGQTMQQVAERLGVSRVRVHQVLRAAGVETGYRFSKQKSKTKKGKVYAAYRLDARTRSEIERLGKAMGLSRTAVVILAIKELAERHPPADTTRTGTGTRAAGDDSTKNQSRKERSARRKAAE